MATYELRPVAHDPIASRSTVMGTLSKRLMIEKILITIENGEMSEAFMNRMIDQTVTRLAKDLAPLLDD